ncbi:polysaccharide deacetylase family protein [Nonlabens tegetincola]|uniref:polysaccharide deacetylase family protein n=1 Tax=Nonlabens tegetincola TaxID=323273 RepID=UPI0030C89F50
MRWYPFHNPDWVTSLFPGCIWHKSRSEKKVYLTFDDGPQPDATAYVLELLDSYGMKATFFCVGDNVIKHPDLYDRILNGGHQTGNHTQHHLNSWKTNNKQYIKNVKLAESSIKSKLFRPPYGKLGLSTYNSLKKLGYQIIMWDVLSGDFDVNQNPTVVLKQLKKHTKNGSIIVFHDSDKFLEMLKQVLPEYLQYVKDNGWETATL